MADNTKPGAAPAKAKRQNPVKAQMSRADSLASFSEFGKIVPKEEQALARASSKKPKPGPFGRLMNALSGK